jgi:alkylation response protein AidB-like acyl-CoA dehydrogenase
VKGISLFLVPKFLVNADGSLGERNDVRCVSIEHKLGIHASPTCGARLRRRRARSATWSARRTAASSTCSS